MGKGLASASTGGYHFGSGYCLIRGDGETFASESHVFGEGAGFGTLAVPRRWRCFYRAFGIRVGRKRGANSNASDAEVSEASSLSGGTSILTSGVASLRSGSWRLFFSHFFSTLMREVNLCIVIYCQVDGSKGGVRSFCYVSTETALEPMIDGCRQRKDRKTRPSQRERKRLRKKPWLPRLERCPMKTPTYTSPIKDRQHPTIPSPLTSPMHS